MANDPAGRISPVDEVQLLRAAACDWRLSRGDIGVFAVILAHCDADHRAFPGPALIAKHARLSVTSVKNSIRQLEQWRYLQIERPGLRKRNRFWILPSPKVIPRSVAQTTRQLGLPSARLSQRGNWSRGLTQSKAVQPRATGQAQQPPTGQARLQKLGKSTRHEVAFESTSESTTPAAPLPEDEDQRIRAYARQLYLQAREQGDDASMRTIERSHWPAISDLTERGQLPPLEA